MKAFENIVGKGENLFSPFPTMFLLPKQFCFMFILLYAKSFILDMCKKFSFDKSNFSGPSFSTLFFQAFFCRFHKIRIIKGMVMVKQRILVLGTIVEKAGITAN